MFFLVFLSQTAVIHAAGHLTSLYSSMSNLIVVISASVLDTFRDINKLRSTSQLAMELFYHIFVLSFCFLDFRWLAKGVFSCFRLQFRFLEEHTTVLVPLLLCTAVRKPFLLLQLQFSVFCTIPFRSHSCCSILRFYQCILPF